MLQDGSHVVAGSAQKEVIERRIRAGGAVLDMPLAQSIYQPLLSLQRRDGVKVIRDQAYGPDSRQRLDVFMPEGSIRPWAMMALLPGGGFIRGDKVEHDNWGYYFAREGVVFLSANYRLAPTHRWPAGAEDAAAIYEWSRRHANDYQVDPGNVFLVGESAGAAHVAALALIRRFHPADGLHVAGTILISGPYNPVLEKLARRQFGVASPDPRNEAYFGSEFERYPAMSTVALMDAVLPAPILITYAELDLVQMQVQAGELFARLVSERGCSPELAVIRGHNHLTQGLAINTGDESLSGPMLEFMRRCLKRPS